MLTRGRRHPLHQKPQPPSPRGEVAGFKSERWPLSNRNRGRLQVEMVAGLKSEKVAAFSWNLQLPGQFEQLMGAKTPTTPIRDENGAIGFGEP
jgi:hypothetical protein